MNVLKEKRFPKVRGCIMSVYGLSDVPEDPDDVDEVVTSDSKLSITGQDVITFLRKNPKEVYESLLHEHRTHQQSTIKSLYCVLKLYGNSNTDLRNEEAVGWAKRATAEEACFPFI